MKHELPKLLQIVSEHEFDFKEDAQESHLCENRIKSRNRRRNNRLDMQVLRANELVISGNDTAQVTSTVDMLQDFDTNADDSSLFRICYIGKMMYVNDQE